MSLKSSLRTIVTLGQGVVRGMPEAAADRDPIELFQEWFATARDSGILLPESMALATATPDAFPSVRMVLLKRVDARGFVFYTNYGSRKAVELEANPRASVCFHWAVLERQVRVAGTVERVPTEESEAYFATRSRGSRIGAWASKQSDALSSRAELEARVKEYEARYPGEEVPLPPYWGGYVLRPEFIEFWQGKADRLHERLRFRRSDEGWNADWLYP
jgi:pyridoxamine 5'-phosphate oxidase